ncbi:hypothetical protein [Myroides sp.]|uniref:hypothetical protein n=1 Tax=Myroides sp. TaxID=1874736 RepID=UPI003F4032A6
MSNNQKEEGSIIGKIIAIVVVIIIVGFISNQCSGSSNNNPEYEYDYGDHGVIRGLD